MIRLESLLNTSDNYRSASTGYYGCFYVKSLHQSLITMALHVQIVRDAVRIESPESDASDTGRGGNKSAAIAGGVSAVVMFLALIGAITVWKERRAINRAFQKTNVRCHLPLGFIHGLLLLGAQCSVPLAARLLLCLRML